MNDLQPQPAILAYRTRQQMLLAEQQAIERRRSFFRAAIAAGLIALVYLYDQAAHRGAHAWPLAIPVVAVGALIPFYLGIQRALLRIDRLQAFYDRCIARADGTETQSGLTGEALRPAGHLYEADLNILGPNSLFGLLATVRTGVGQRGLADYLLQAVSQEESLARQEAVRALTANLQLREEIALLGSSRFQEVQAQIFDAWLDEPAPSFHPAIRVVLVVTPLLLAGMAVAGLAHLAAWGVLLPNLAAVAAVQAGVSMLARRRVLPILAASKVADQMQLFSDGIALMQAQGFASAKLLELQGLCEAGDRLGNCLPGRKKANTSIEKTAFTARVNACPSDSALAAGGNACPSDSALAARGNACPSDVEVRLSRSKTLGAVAAIRRIQSQFVIVEQRTKEYFFVFSLLLAAGTHAAISIANWKRDHAGPMKLWLAAWGEFEALNALACYAFEHEENAYPELLPSGHPPTFEAKTLGHPLLPPAVCVSNDIALGAETRFYLISGSNMAGKSTLLRAIGINAVLAYAGAPVRAAECRLSPLTITASLALTDSLAEGKSKFLAEVERLQRTLAAAEAGPTLFLIDEIFSGTNSTDRRVAAEAVLERLLAHGAIGALSTHDLALTELATVESRGMNVHMASPDAEDPLGFDYRLKPGVNPSSNALAMIRMMGIEARG